METAHIPNPRPSIAPPAPTRPASALWPRLRGAALVCAVAAVYAAGLLAVPVLRVLSVPVRWLRRRRAPGTPARVLLTGRFDSRNWARAHVVPIAEAACVGEVLAVVDGPTVPHDKIRYCPPPRWLVRTLGRALSKAVWVVWLGWRHPPDLVIGYHLFPNALTALLAARLLGARAAYQMTGGHVEIEGGGARTENALLSRLNGPSALLESLALRLCRRFDTIVVRGGRVKRLLETRGAARRVDVIAGAIDVDRFCPDGLARTIDLAYVGRLMPIKQPEHVLHVVAALRAARPNVSAVLVGDGPLLGPLQDLAQRLGIQHNVTFLGHAENVVDVLRRTEVFLLTSRSEGLSIALAEGMATGAVPVVADVGELAELVQQGETGYRVPPGDFSAYARRIGLLLDDDEERQRLSCAARRRAVENNSLEEVTARWERCLRAVCSGAAPVPPGTAADRKVVARAPAPS